MSPTFVKHWDTKTVPMLESTLNEAASKLLCNTIRGHVDGVVNTVATNPDPLTVDDIIRIRDELLAATKPDPKIEWLYTYFYPIIIPHNNPIIRTDVI